MSDDPTYVNLERDDEGDIKGHEPSYPPEGRPFENVPAQDRDDVDDAGVDIPKPNPEAERRAALDAAREHGARSRRMGMPRRYVPPALRADFALTDAYWAGFDEAGAQMANFDREAYSAGWRAQHNGFEREVPASLGSWGSAWASWISGWNDAETANGSRS